MNDGEYIRIMRPLRTGGGGREGVVVVVVSMVLLGWMMARNGNDSGNDGLGRQTGRQRGKDWTGGGTRKRKNEGPCLIVGISNVARTRRLGCGGGYVQDAKRGEIEIERLGWLVGNARESVN